MDQKQNSSKVEIWGGAECSLVRIGCTVYDQLKCSGHEERTQDIECFNDLGITTIRYPLLWEKFTENEAAFFRFHDSRLNRIRELGISPIAGLVHHGSGPFFTDLSDNRFPDLLAEYASKIAQRYPWIEFYTPVNEPLTTARFSGLYGIWYPHLKSDEMFSRILLNELKGIILSMKAIKSINSSAGLIQTEDLCRIYHTDQLKYQADFENQRRWISYDLLTGRLDPSDVMFKYFLKHNITEKELLFLNQNTVIPAVCGFNYYVTSNRYLDHRKEIYPTCFHGGNSLQEYADVEAVRANTPDNTGSYNLLKEAWERYKLPIALTEVHLACTREEQLRWFYEAWQSANFLKNEGVDIRAITAWSFFGSYDWSSLLRVKNDDYESGVYDVRSGIPRATALAGLIKSLNNEEKVEKHLLNVPGWWRRSDRLIFKGENEKLKAAHYDLPVQSKIRPLLITGNGSLGKAVSRICTLRGIIHILAGKEEIDISSFESVDKAIARIEPWAILNAAGFSKIDEAENMAFSCFRDNTIGPVILAESCKNAQIRFVTFSADQVFNGRKLSPYCEGDITDPVNIYGLSKKLAEEKVLNIYPGSLIIRSSFFFNPWHAEDPLVRLFNTAEFPGRRFYLPSDIIISPAYIPHLVNHVLDLLIDGESGIWHLSSRDEISFADFVLKALKIADRDYSYVSPIPYSKMGYAARRPVYSVLESSSGIKLPGLESSLNNFIGEYLRSEGQQIRSHSSSYTEVL
ncbi:MAG TPA: family 1 glycosylhydrolase [Bacteroidales bacterium]|nr:family 1 glycosylhydrolase [Bacteroidales bacterium]